MIKWTKKDAIRYITELKSPLEERKFNGNKARLPQIAERLRQLLTKQAGK